MMKKHILFFCLLLVSAQLAFGQNKPYAPDPDAQPRALNIDMLHMLLNVRFQPEKGLVIGEVVDSFRPLPKKIDTIFLDGPGISFKSVKLNGEDVPFTQTPWGVHIAPKKKLSRKDLFELRVSYEASPRKGIYFIGWDDSTSRSRKQIWTQGEMTDNRYWIPSVDDRNDKLITEVNVTMDNKYKVLSNGMALQMHDNGDGTFSWHYKINHPHSLYLVMLGIGDYAVKNDHSRAGVPLQYWYYPDQPEKLEPTYRYTPDIMDFFENEIGVKYAWGAYSQIPVQNFIYGAMENTSATIFGDFFCVDKREYLDRNYVAVNAHEMAHQWFGDLITGKNGRDQWLQEGFATHYSKIALKSIFGEEWYEWNKRQEQNTALEASRKDLMPIAHNKAGGARIYQKASFVLDMLKDTVGHDNYNLVVKKYLEKYGYANPSTEDFENMFKEVLGMDMHWFFDEWIYRGGEPHYHVQYSTINEEGKPLTQLIIKQTQPLDSYTNYFSMPVVVEVHYKDGSMDRKKEWVTDSMHIMTVPNPQNKQIAYVLFDPGNHVLKDIDFNKGIDELKAQALNAPLMIDRYDAIAAMKSFGFYQKREILLQIFQKNPYFPIQEEIVSQMANDDNPLSRKILLLAAKDNDAGVRLKAVSEIQQLPDSLRPAFENLLKDSSYAVVTAALKKLSELFPDRKQQYLAMTDGQYGMAKATRIAWLELATEQPDDKYMKELSDYASNAFEFRTRLIAFDAMNELNSWNKPALISLLEACTSWNGRLAGPATDILKTLQKSGYRQKLKDAYKSTQWNHTQAAILAKLLG